MIDDLVKRLASLPNCTGVPEDEVKWLAEHGIFGLIALMLLGWMSYQRLRRPAPLLSKAIVAAFTAWSLLYMFHAAMRMSIVSFIFALGSSFLLARSGSVAR